MNYDEQTLLMVKGLIASLPEDKQAAVKEAEGKIRDVLAQYPEGEAMLAFSMIGAQMQLEG